jgi:hypothetical protein
VPGRRACRIAAQKLGTITRDDAEARRNVPRAPRANRFSKKIENRACAVARRKSYAAAS